MALTVECCVDAATGGGGGYIAVENGCKAHIMRKWLLTVHSSTTHGQETVNFIQCLEGPTNDLVPEGKGRCCTEFPNK